uniref:Uncharacterized protein n=1 Tax=Chrysotila carterae TaxID=13221 RepID=A0A7S4B0D9_CHRCT
MIDKTLIPANFGDGGGEVVTLPSSWRRAVVSSEKDSQTEPVVLKARGMQEPAITEMEVQTETIEEGGMAEQLPLVSNNFTESVELTNFLLQSTPLLEEQLLRNVNSSAFDKHDVSWEEQHDQVDCLHALKHSVPLSNTATAAASSLDSCSAVAWNASGTVVAAAYSPFDAHNWPDGESVLCTWSVFRRSMDPSKADLALALSSSLTSLAFHPTDPSVLAGGACNGDVLLFDLSQKDDQLWAKSSLSSYTHQEPVLQVAWSSTPLHGRVLCSISADGKMLVWTVANKLLHPVLGFKLPKPVASKTFIEGGACFAFSREDPTTFVAGLEAGKIFKCSLFANEERRAEVVRMQRGDLPWDDAAAALMTRVPAAHYHRLKARVEKEAVLARENIVTLGSVYAASPDQDLLFRSPVAFPLAPHGGPVYGAHFSPFHRNVVLSVSTDSSVRIYNVLNPRPLLVLEPTTASLFACAWSPFRPLVFAVAAADGNLYIYDLKRNKGRPEVTLKVTTDKSAVYSVAFNPRSSELLTTADGQGVVKVWRLSGALSTMVPRELEALDALATTRAAATADDGDDDSEGDGYGDGDDDNRRRESDNEEAGGF